jgi:RHS repeat-associated protein
VPVSVQVGADPTTAPRYSYVFDARGDVANLTDASGGVVATYTYDTWGTLTASSESIPNANGWTNPYRFDGRDGVRSDAATGLDWLATRAYDPTADRFISRDPLGRAPLYLADNPYVYAGNNPLSNVDPSGQYRVAGVGATESGATPIVQQTPTRIQPTTGCDPNCQKVKAAHIQQDWMHYYEQAKARLLVNVDKLHVGLDVGFLLVDGFLAIAATDVLAWVSVVTDIVGLGADIAQFVKDQSLADGNFSNSLALSKWGSVLNSLSLIANTVNVLMQFGMFLGDYEAIVKKGLTEVASKVLGGLFSGIQAANAGGNLTLDQLDADELELQHMSVEQLIKLGEPPTHP